MDAVARSMHWCNMVAMPKRLARNLSLPSNALKLNESGTVNRTQLWSNRGEDKKLSKSKRQMNRCAIKVYL
jgi:hypothetical protein